jgi:surfactin synthase thioesterase subunit
MMPGIRADMLMGKRMHLDKMSPLACPLVAIAGNADHVFTLDQVKGWEKQTTQSFRFEVVSGGHLFMRENRDELLAIIRRSLTD